VYEAKDSQHPERRYFLNIEAKAVTPGAITEAITRPNGEVQEVTHRGGLVAVGAGPGIVAFAPFLRVFQDLKEGERWNNMEYRNLFRCNVGFDCSISGRVAGRERVTVKAGTYDATKVVLEIFSRNSAGGTAVIEARYWYAEAANRMIKYELRTTSTQFSQPLMDMELVSYTQAGG
jgi:hypothetical protein